MPKALYRTARAIWTPFANLSMEKKLFVVFVFLITLPIIAASYFSYRSNTESIVDNSTANFSQLTADTMDKVDRYISDMYRNSILPLYAKDIQQFMITPGTDWDKRTRIELFLTYLNNVKNESAAVYLVDSYGNIFSNYKYEFTRSDPDKDLPGWKKLLEQSNRKPVLVGTHPVQVGAGQEKYVFSIIREVQLTESLEPIGFIVFDVDIHMMEGIVKRIDKVTHGYTRIVDGENRVIYDRNPGLLAKQLEVSPLPASKAGASGHFRTTIDGVRYLCTYKTSSLTGWKALTYTPLQHLMAPAQKNRNLNITLTLMIVAFALVVSILISFALTRPLRRLVRLMKEVQRGNLDVRLKVKYNDEIGILGGHFNRMLSNIKELIQEVYVKEKRKKEAELRGLQSQINPHFIYNSLESIRMMAEMNDDEPVAESTYLLGKLLRYGIIRGNEVVTVARELEHLHDYMKMQNIRFSNKYVLETDIPPHLAELPMIKLVFQPIVENSMLHGFEKLDHTGCISITAKEEGDYVRFWIKDNGTGMDRPTLARINGYLQRTGGNIPPGRAGIGLHNVNERIRLHFGEDCGIRIVSEPDDGTLVILTVPAGTNQRI